MRRRTLVAGAGAAFLLVSCAGSVDLDREIAAIRAINERVRQAHWQADAEGFLAAHRTTWLSVANGSVDTVAKANALPRLQQYLSEMTFEEISYQAEPIVHVSTDGRSAWLIGQVMVRGSRRQEDGTSKPIAFASAWVDLYQKSGGQWQLVARAGSDRPVAEAD